MGYRRRRRTTEVVQRHSYVGRRSAQGLCTSGTLLFLLLCISCASDERGLPVETAVLTIGVPESDADGTELGMGQLARAITLEGLTQLTTEGRAVPRLAESWTVEHRQLRLTLRKNVLLHDGSRLDAQSAAEALAAAVANESNRASYPALQDVRGAIPQGNSELVLELRGPSPRLPDDLTVLLDIPAGPYRIVKDTTLAKEFERFAHYYQGVPGIPRVTIKSFDTMRTGWASLLRGELDMVYDVPADTVQFIRNEDIEVISVPRAYQYHVAFNSHRGPFKSALVRKALNMAIDRTSLIDKVLHGAGVPSAGPLYPKFWAYDSSQPMYPFDPATASTLLDAAGYRVSTTESGGPAVRFRFTCLLPQNFTVWERVALEVQRDLFNVGVDMQFQVVPLTDFGQLIGTGQFEAALINMISGPTPARPYIWWRSARHFKGRNVFGYDNEEAERQFEVLLRSTNEAAMRSASSKLQKISFDDPPALFIAWDMRSRAISRRFDWPDDVDPMFSLWKWTPRRAE